MVHPIRLSLVAVLMLFIMLAVPQSSMAASRDSHPQNPPAADSAIVLLTRCTKEGNCNSYLSTTCSNGVQLGFKTDIPNADKVTFVINPTKNTTSVFVNGTQQASNITPNSKGVINFPGGSPLIKQLGASSAELGVSGLLLGSSTYPFASISCA